MLYIAICSALLPVLLLLFYIYHKDSLQPEPVRWLWKAVCYGVGSAVIVSVWGAIYPGFTELFSWTDGTVIGSIGTAFIDAAIPEEAAKLLMLWLLIRKNPYFDEHLDGIVYATCVGLGFAGLENILYVVDSLDSFVSVAVSRALFAVPGHFFFAVAMGYFLSLAYFEGRNKTFYYLLAYIVPVLLHGIYDGILMSMQTLPMLSGLLVLVFLLFVHYLRKSGLRRIEEMGKKEVKEEVKEVEGS